MRCSLTKEKDESPKEGTLVFRAFYREVGIQKQRQSGQYTAGFPDAEADRNLAGEKVYWEECRGT